MAKDTTRVQIEGKSLQLSNLSKVLYPADGFTKAQVLDYYARVAPYLLPHVAGRPLTLKRYPEGVDAGHFYEKRCPSHKPDWLPTITVAGEDHKRPISYCVINDLADLTWVANMASLELHTLLSRGDVREPTMMVFDLDPGPPATVFDCIPVARTLRQELAERRLQCFVKTSGGKGLHLYVPLNTADVRFEQTKALARELAQELEQRLPGMVVSKMSKQLRAGKVFVDWSQNDEHKTTVCAYSLRAREHPTVSTPITWEELLAIKRRTQEKKLVFRTNDVLKRVEKLGDLFAPVETLKQRLPGEGAAFRRRAS